MMLKNARKVEVEVDRQRMKMLTSTEIGLTTSKKIGLKYILLISLKRRLKRVVSVWSILIVDRDCGSLKKKKIMLIELPFQFFFCACNYLGRRNRRK